MIFEKRIKRLIEPLIQQWYEATMIRCQATEKLFGRLAQEIEDRTTRGINAVNVEARFAMKNVEGQVAAKLAELDVPRYDWNQTAEGILKRIAAIERQQTLIRDKNFQIEQALLLLGVKLQENAGEK